MTFLTVLFSTFLTPFILGLLTPLTAVCILPFYPAFLAFLSRSVSKAEGKSKQKTLFVLGLLIVAGVIAFMFLLGLVFTTILSVSLTKVIGIISPIAFIILALISILLIFNVDFGRFLPRGKTPGFKNPYTNAFLFGFFFGAIIIPCNPLFIAAFFATAASTGDFISNMLQFTSFGLGIGAPLLLFSILSLAMSDKIIATLVRYSGAINRTAGVIMLVISLYYLIFVFQIFS